MSHTEPLTGARIPDSTDNAALYTHISNAVVDLSSKTIPRFTTNAARDTAYTNWVNAGNTMVDGLVCVVGGAPMLYRSGAWGRIGDVGKPRIRLVGSIAVPSATLFGIGPTGSMAISTAYAGDTYIAAIQDGLVVQPGIYQATFNATLGGGQSTNGRSFLQMSGSASSNILSRVPVSNTGETNGTNSTTLFFPAAQNCLFLMYLTMTVGTVTISYNVDMVRMGDF